MKECISEKQRLYHLVAEQYVIADLESGTMDDAKELRERICEKIYGFIESENFEAVFSISAGVTRAEITREGYEEFRKKVKFSLKQARTMGKNSFYVFREEDYNVFLRKEKIVGAFRNAIANGYQGIEVYYQPITDCMSEKIIGAEALMRFTMTSAAGEESISPVEFIPLLEETGLIIPAGRFVLNEAAKTCSEIGRRIPHFRMNVNVSCVQIMQGNIERDVRDVVKKYGLEPECLCIEMTESGFMDMTAAFCSFRESLSQNNIQFVIDDFGTGYSNLHCISDMNPSYIKLDRMFTAKSMNSEKYYQLFTNIISMVHSINIKICAEGIEQRDWCEKMQEMKVDFLQGYYFGRPCNKRDFFEQLGRQD